MTDSPPFQQHRSPSTGRNALIGGITSIVLAFLPFSPLIGGFLAGYLHEDDRTAALNVGALAGLIALIPLVFVGMVVILFGAFGMLAGAPRASVFFVIMILIAGTLSILYTIGLSAAGGLLGAIVAEEYTNEYA